VRWHETAETAANAARENIREAVAAAANCGDAIHDWIRARHGRGLAELRDCVPVGRAKHYLSLARIRRNDGAIRIDRAAIRQLALFEGPEERDESERDKSAPKRADADLFAAAMTAIARASEAMAKLLEWLPTSLWSPGMRMAISDHLRGFTELLEAINSDAE
jgi:hypothetical protein